MTTDFAAVLASLSADRTAARIWAREVGVFAPPPAPSPLHEAIRQRLGWLDAPGSAGAALASLRAFADEVRADGLSDVVLLGMGGSSLCAEVLRDIPGPRRWDATLTVLDTTDERAVQRAQAALVPARTLFIVASKSGSTIEVDALERYFWSVMESSLGAAAGAHFIAITDPGTPLTRHGGAHGYRRVFLNAPDIGGRYSALSLFGLVPAALIGLDLDSLVGSANQMAAECQHDRLDNPGLALGAFIGAHARAGRDKLTLLLPDELRPLGPWIEQLVAESTGKNGRGVLPIVDEPTGRAAEYSPDRAFVASAAIDSARRAELERAGHPVFLVEAAPASLGAEFFRWEMATAVAGIVLGVNPFDEPNVREAKQRTQAQLDDWRQHGAFTISPPFTTRDGVREREHHADAQPIDGGYLAILDYLPAEPARSAEIAALRAAIRTKTGLATTYGVGPRYLHSTGQYHKGGPNTGRFVLLTADDGTTTPVPGTDYTFSALKRAQALGDFEALVAAGRDVTHIDGITDAQTLQTLLIR